MDYDYTYSQEIGCSGGREKAFCGPQRVGPASGQQALWLSVRRRNGLESLASSQDQTCWCEAKGETRRSVSIFVSKQTHLS